ncbi:MAG: transglycosylase domain-containing protein, partial [Clostridia bacterium]
MSYLIFFNPNNIKLDKNKLLLSRNNVVVKDCVGDNISNDLMFNTIEMSNLNDYTKQAFIVLEDKRFYSHNGIDTTRMVGAMLANLKSNSIAQGGSTITQQLIKNTHLTNEKTMRRKFNEIGLSLQIERQYNKNDILSMYLNTIYFGEGAYGINNAAKTYFNKTADNLSIEESATLVAIIKAPTYYNPTVNIAKCKERRNIVLKLMRDSDVINQQQYEDAIDKDIVVKISERTKDNSSYVNSAIIEASKALGMSQLEILNQKYIISTYLDSDTQKKLIEAIDSNKTLAT